MKNALCLFVVLVQLAGVRVFAAEETAYTALRAVGKQIGKDALNHVIEVRGKGGAPSPEVWRITLEDPAARGGVREFEVQHGKIIADRSPLGHLLVQPMNFNNLNLDSDGAFTIANEEATHVGVPFDHADYTLKSGGHNTPPTWVVDLFDGRNGRAATIGIGADNGSVLHRDIVSAPAQSAPSPQRPVFHDAPPPTAPPPSASDDPVVARVSGFFDHVKRKITHHFEKRKRQFENFFSGKSWSADGPDEGIDDRDFRRDEQSDRKFEKDLDQN